MSHQVELNGSCQEVTESFPLPPAEYSSESGMLEVGEGPPAPPWLQAIVSSILAKEKLSEKSIKEDCFVALLFVLVHEMGFTVRGFHQVNPSSSFNVNVLRSLTDIDPVDRAEFSYQIPLSLHCCDVPCELVVVPVLNTNVFIVNFHIPEVDTFSVSYDIDNYIVLTPDRSLKLKNQHQLAKSFKDVCHRFRNAVLDHVDMPSLHITKMPYEILLKISSYLDPQSFVYFSTCCKYFKESVNLDEFIWKRLYKVHFKPDSVPSASCTWKKHFMDETKNKVMSRRFHRCEVMPYSVLNLTPPHHFMRLPRL